MNYLRYHLDRLPGRLNRSLAITLHRPLPLYHNSLLTLLNTILARLTGHILVLEEPSLYHEIVAIYLDNAAAWNNGSRDKDIPMPNPLWKQWEDD